MKLHNGETQSGGNINPSYEKDDWMNDYYMTAVHFERLCQEDQNENDSFGNTVLGLFYK